MIETRLALPVRSPTPFIVPWTWRAPTSTAASVLATPHSASLWQWMADADAVADRGDARAAVAAATCGGSDEPLVSHRATVSAPAPAAARRQSSA